ncbi:MULTISPECIES: Clp protease N-terminal domain-containing protein [unclassified Streptomyces]|uniref:Clp protease N-terminal domain-containing protein n=1 Tax=unclassified Streptomyces TaxID=2593676 RepID=UPI002E32477E|nr:Clp protease N-terminal domain-containing protein [Streptomyces sp. NBC_01268]
MFEQFAAAARAAVNSALGEAALRGDRRIGTEHLLLGVLHDPESVRAFGTDLESARAALDALDRSALAAVGIDVQGIERPPIPPSRKRTPFTSGARAVLPRALAETRRAGSRRIAPEHLLMALLDCEQPDPAAELMERCGVDRAAVRERVRRTGA